MTFYSALGIQLFQYGIGRGIGGVIGCCPGQRILKVGGSLRRMQPTFVVRNDGGGTHQLDSRFLFFDEHLATGELFAKRDLSICANNFDAGLGSQVCHCSLLMFNCTKAR